MKIILKKIDCHADIENLMTKCFTEGKEITQIEVTKRNFLKLKQVMEDNLRMPFNKESKLNTIFGELPIIIK